MGMRAPDVGVEDVHAQHMGPLFSDIKDFELSADQGHALSHDKQSHACAFGFDDDVVETRPIISHFDHGFEFPRRDVCLLYTSPSPRDS